MFVVEVVEHGTVVLVRQERIKARAHARLEKPKLAHTTGHTGILLDINLQRAGEDQTMINLMQQNRDKIILLARHATINADIPRRLDVNLDKDVKGALALLLAVQVFAANGLCGRDGHDLLQLIDHADTVPTATDGKHIRAAEVDKQNLHTDGDATDPGHLNDADALLNGRADLERIGRADNLDVEGTLRAAACTAPLNGSGPPSSGQGELPICVDKLPEHVALPARTVAASAKGNPALAGNKLNAGACTGADDCGRTQRQRQREA